MGLSHHVPEGALLDFAGKLDATKPWHRISAWALLVVFGLPVVFAVLRLLDALSRLAATTRRRRRPSSMPRHISSVLPSAHMTYRSSRWVSNAGSWSRSHCWCWQVTRTVSPASRCTGSIGLAPWLSKSQIGMSQQRPRLRRCPG